MAHERIPRRHPILFTGITSIAQHHGENADPAREVANRRMIARVTPTISRTEQDVERSCHAKARLALKAGTATGCVVVTDILRC
jgi:hypothetical protein